MDGVSRNHMATFPIQQNVRRGMSKRQKGIAVVIIGFIFLGGISLIVVGFAGFNNFLSSSILPGIFVIGFAIMMVVCAFCNQASATSHAIEMNESRNVQVYSLTGHSNENGETMYPDLPPQYETEMKASLPPSYESVVNEDNAGMSSV